MDAVFGLIPADKSFKPSALDVAMLLRYLLDGEFIDNDDVYVDIAYESGRHRPGVSNLVSVEDAITALEEVDELEVTDYSVANIRGTSSIPALFENADEKNLSQMGWLALRVYETAYPILDTEQEYSIRCGFCGREAPVREWSSEGVVWQCPACSQMEELPELEFVPEVEFARFILEITDLSFTDIPPRLSAAQPLVAEIENAFGCTMKSVWYSM